MHIYNDGSNKKNNTTSTTVTEYDRQSCKRVTDDICKLRRTTDVI